jgi:hypothetical protein
MSNILLNLNIKIALKSNISKFRTHNWSHTASVLSSYSAKYIRAYHIRKNIFLIGMTPKK